MAEAFGTAAGVIQVAEVGFSLAQTLYKYAASVKGAEKEIKKIARDVKLTSKVLERTHEQLKADQQAQLCTEDALVDLEEVLDGCREAFEEVNDTLTKSMRPSASGKVSLSTSEKLKWPLRSNKLEVLRANLEKLKTSLLLMLSVLAYGSKISQSHVSRTEIKVELTLEKLQIQNLVQAKDEATQRYEELTAAFQTLEARVNDSVKNSQGSGIAPASTICMFGLSGETLPSSNDAVCNPPSSNVPDEAIISEVPTRLDKCAEAVGRLTQSIAAATMRWKTDQVLEHGKIALSLNETTEAVQSLTLWPERSKQDMHAANPPGSNHALQDYQMQLMLLEQQNKKRHLMARQEQDSAAVAIAYHAPQPHSADRPWQGSMQLPPLDFSDQARRRQMEMMQRQAQAQAQAQFQFASVPGPAIGPMSKSYAQSQAQRQSQQQQGPYAPIVPASPEDVVVRVPASALPASSEALSGSANAAQLDAQHWRSTRLSEQDAAQAPFSDLSYSHFESIDFANIEPGNTLDNFDFDSFLDHTSGDDGLGFGARPHFPADIVVKADLCIDDDLDLDLGDEEVYDGETKSDDVESEDEADTIVSGLLRRWIKT